MQRTNFIKGVKYLPSVFLPWACLLLIGSLALAIVELFFMIESYFRDQLLWQIQRTFVFLNPQRRFHTTCNKIGIIKFHEKIINIVTKIQKTHAIHL